MAITSPSFLSVEARSEMTRHDKTWMSKTILRIILFVCNIVAIGCIGWSVSQRFSGAYETSDSGYYYDGGALNYGIIWSMVPLGLSCVWALVVIPVLLVRRKPAHPGFSVAFDLILAIAFLILGGAYCTLAYANLNDNSYINDSSSGDYFGCGSSYSYYGPSSSSSYVYTNCQQGESYIPYSESYSYTYDNGTTIERQPGSPDYNCPAYDTCALQDQAEADQSSFLSFYHRIAIVGLVAAIFISISAIIHVILFIWACVDTHAYNRSAVYDQRARVLADQMINDMRQRGELPMQNMPLLNQPTAYQGSGGPGSTQSLPNLNGQQLPSGLTHPAFRQNPGDIEGQYADGPRLGNPLRNVGQQSYQPVATAAADADAIQQQERSARFA